MKEKILERVTTKNTHDPMSNETYVVHTESTTTTLSVTSDAQNLDFTKLSDCQCLEQLDIYRCNNVRSIDLSALDGNPTLKFIRIHQNGPIEHLIMPSGCENLTEFVITENKSPPAKSIPVLVGPRDFLNRFVTSDQKIPRPLIDLSTLDGSPSLRVFKLSDNEFGLIGVILPSHCPNLHVIVLNNTIVKEWRLEECPRLQLVKLKTSRPSLDLGSLFSSYKSSQKPPIIDIDIRIEKYLEHLIVDYEDIPQKIKERIIPRYVFECEEEVDENVLIESMVLLCLYGIVTSPYNWHTSERYMNADFPRRDFTLLGTYSDY